MAVKFRGRTFKDIAAAKKFASGLKEFSGKAKKRKKKREPIRLGDQFSKPKQTRKAPAIIRALGSPKLTLWLAAILGGLVAAPAATVGLLTGAGRFLGKGLFGTPTRALVSTALTGAAITSPTIRSSLANLPKAALSAGKALGEAVEEKGGKDGILGFTPLGLLAGAGLVAAGAAAIPAAKAVGGAVGGFFGKDDLPAAPTIAGFAPIAPGTLQAVPTGQVPAVSSIEQAPGAVKPKKKSKSRSRKVNKVPMINNIIQIQNIL